MLWIVNLDWSVSVIKVQTARESPVWGIDEFHKLVFSAYVNIQKVDSFNLMSFDVNDSHSILD